MAKTVEVDGLPPRLIMPGDDGVLRLPGDVLAPFVRQSPYISREAVDGPLRAFVEAVGADGRTLAFQWTLMLGMPGSGRHRAALELCRHFARTHQAGFLSLRQSADDGAVGSAEAFADGWRKWRPSSPTLMVIDDFTFAMDRLRAMLAVLGERADEGTLEHPVRVLLIERVGGRYWEQTEWGRFLLRGFAAPFRWRWRCRIGGESSEKYAQHFKTYRSLIVPSWTVAELTMLSAGLGLEAGGRLPTEEDSIWRTGEVRAEGEMRPLFPLLAVGFGATSLAQIRHEHTGEALIEVVVEQIVDGWGAVDGRQVNLLALATLLGGLTREDLIAFREDAVLQKVLPQPDEWDNEVYLRMTGVAATDWLAPLRPELVGSQFAVRRLAVLDTAAREALAHALWRWSGQDAVRIVRVSEGLCRLRGDVGPKSVYWSAVREVCLAAPGDTVPAESWLRLAGDLIIDACLASCWDVAPEIFNAIRQVVHRPGKEELRNATRRALPCLVMAYMKSKRYDDAEREVEELRALVKTEEDLRDSVCLANVLSLCCGGYAADGRIEHALEALAELRLLTDTVGAARFRHHLVYALWGVTAGKQGALSTAGFLDLLDEARGLRLIDNSRRIRSYLASMLVNVNLELAAAGRIDLAIPLVEEVRALRRADDCEDIRENLARIFLNMTCELKRSGRTEEMNAGLEELRALRAADDRPAMREILAGAFVNATCRTSLGSSLDATRALVGELRALREADDRKDIREQFAGAIVNALIVLSEEGSVETGKMLVEELRALQRDDDRPLMRDRLVQGLAVYGAAISEEGDLEGASAILEELEMLRTECDSPKIREQLAYMINSMTLNLGRNGSDEQAYQMLERLRTLHNEDDQPVITECFAGALAAAAANHGSRGRVDAGCALVDELRRLWKAEGGVDVASEVAYALARLCYWSVKEERLVEVRQLVQQLRELREAEDVEDVRKRLAESVARLARAEAMGGRLDDGLELVQELRDLCAVDDRQIVLEKLAFGICGVAIELGDTGRDAEWEALVDELRAIRRQHDCQETRLRLAWVLANGVQALNTPEHLLRADRMLQELRSLFEADRQESVREAFAWALSEMTDANGLVSRVDEVLALLGELREVAAPSEDPDVQESLTDGLENVAGLLEAAGRTEEAEQLRAEAGELRSSEGGEE